jgi:hypothetical protein
VSTSATGLPRQADDLAAVAPLEPDRVAVAEAVGTEMTETVLVDDDVTTAGRGDLVGRRAFREQKQEQRLGQPAMIDPMERSQRCMWGTA